MGRCHWQPIAVPAIDDLIGSPFISTNPQFKRKQRRAQRPTSLLRPFSFQHVRHLNLAVYSFRFELTEDSPILGTALEMVIARRHSLGIGGYLHNGYQYDNPTPRSDQQFACVNGDHVRNVNAFPDRF